VFIDFAEALYPVLEFAAGDADPGDKVGDGDVGLIGPGADEVDQLVADIVGYPTFVQGSPVLFFSWVRASMSSAMTSFLRWILASSSWIFRCWVFSTVLVFRGLSKERWAFSKRTRCQK